MKTVKITIEVKVPNKTRFVAVDKDGIVYAYNKQPTALQNESRWDIAVSEEEQNLNIKGFSKREISNWRETLTELD